MDKRQLIGALRGDRNAAIQIAGQMLPRYHSKLAEFKATIDDKHRTEWDEQARRREAYEEGSSPEQAMGAASTVFQQILRITRNLPTVFVVDDHERPEAEKELADEIYSLAVMLCNPTIRYAIIGTIDEDVREELDTYLIHSARELWGTVWALTSNRETTVDDFPPRTRQAIRQANADRIPPDERENR